MVKVSTTATALALVLVLHCWKMQRDFKFAGVSESWFDLAGFSWVNRGSFEVVLCTFAGLNARYFAVKAIGSRSQSGRSGVLISFSSPRLLD